MLNRCSLSQVIVKLCIAWFHHIGQLATADTCDWLRQGVCLTCVRWRIWWWLGLTRTTTRWDVADRSPGSWQALTTRALAITRVPSSSSQERNCITVCRPSWPVMLTRYSGYPWVPESTWILKLQIRGLESPWKVLECDLLVLENVDRIIEGYLFELFFLG